MNTLHLKTGDTAVVLSGKEKGKQGKVLSVNPKKGMVVVEGVNMITCHQKPRRQGETGGIVKREGALRACKLMKVCPKCGKPEGCRLQEVRRDHLRRRFNLCPD